MSFLKPYTTIPFILAGILLVYPLASLRAQNETPAPSAAAALVPLSANTPSGTTAPEEWSKEWMKKYVVITSKAKYVHVLLDAETIYQSLLGPSNHSAVAAEAWSLVQHYPFPADASDLVKMDIVHFKNRDNYGQPNWDSLERIGHLEFSRKVLSRTSPNLLAKPEKKWKAAFTVLGLYD